jgi:hypothetical protein
MIFTFSFSTTCPLPLIFFYEDRSVMIAWSCIVTDSLWIKPTDALDSNFIGIMTVHVSGSLSAHHQEFLAAHRLWYILCSYDDRLLPGAGRNCSSILLLEHLLVLFTRKAVVLIVTVTILKSSLHRFVDRLVSSSALGIINCLIMPLPKSVSPLLDHTRAYFSSLSEYVHVHS